LTAIPTHFINLKRRGHIKEEPMQRVLVLAALALAITGGSALAISDAVKQACSSDYAAYCSEHKVGTPALRSCMREHRKMLSGPCIKALGASDEVTPQEVSEYKREMQRD
jgi:hypothetical protein